MCPVKKTAKRQKLPEEVRRASILEAAHQLFAQHGFQATTMDQVAARAGLTKGGLYFHFKDKRTLFGAVVANHINFIDQRLAELQSEVGDPEQRLRQFFQAMVEEMSGEFLRVDQPEGFPGAVEVFMEGHRLMFAQGDIRGVYRRVRSFVAQAVEAGLKEGLFPQADPEAAAVAAVSLIIGLYLQYASDPKAFDFFAMAERLCEGFIAGLKRGV